MKKTTYKTTEIVEVEIVGHRILGTSGTDGVQNLVIDNKEYYSEQIPPYTTVYMENGHLTDIVSRYYTHPFGAEYHYNEGFFYRAPVLLFYEKNQPCENDIIIPSVPYIEDIRCQFVDAEVIEPSFQTIDKNGEVFLGTYDECYKEDKIFNLYGKEHNIEFIASEIEDLEKYYVLYDHYDECVPFTNIFSKELKLTVRKILLEDGNFEFRTWVEIPGHKEYTEDFSSFRLLSMYAKDRDTVEHPGDTDYLRAIREYAVRRICCTAMRSQYPEKHYDNEKLYIKLLTVLDYNNGNKSYIILNGNHQKIKEAIPLIAKRWNGIKRHFFEPSVGDVVELHESLCWVDFEINKIECEYYIG